MNQLPSMIYPTKVGLNHFSGSVPLSFSFTWTRFQPRLEKLCSDHNITSILLILLNALVIVNFKDFLYR